MARIDRDVERAQLVVESAVEGTMGDVSSRNPMVLSCGGIFVPRPKYANPDTLYQILNIANSDEPTKIVSGSVPQNILQEVLHKESMN